MTHFNALQNLDCNVKFVWPSEWDVFDNANFSYDFGWQKQDVVLSVQLSYFIRDCMRTPQRNITHCSRWSQTLTWCLWSSLNSIACINEANGNRVNANRYGSCIYLNSRNSRYRLLPDFTKKPVVFHDKLWLIQIAGI